MDYFTNEFTTRKELEAWINDHANLNEKSYYWGFIEDCDKWYSLNDLLADISDDWFEDPNGNKLTVTVYEAC